MDNRKDKSNMKREKATSPVPRAPTPDLLLARGSYGLSGLYDGAYRATLNPLESGRRKEPKPAKAARRAPPPKPKPIPKAVELTVNRRIRN